MPTIQLKPWRYRYVMLAAMACLWWIVTFYVGLYRLPESTDWPFIAILFVAGSTLVVLLSLRLKTSILRTVLVYLAGSFILAKLFFPTERRHYIDYIFSVQMVVLAGLAVLEVWLVIAMFAKICRAIAGGRTDHVTDAVAALGPLSNEWLMREIYVREFGIWYFLIRRASTLADIYAPHETVRLRASPLIWPAVLFCGILFGATSYAFVVHHWGWLVPALVLLYLVMFLLADLRARRFLGVRRIGGRVRIDDGLIRSMEFDADVLQVQAVATSQLTLKQRFLCMPPMAKPNVAIRNDLTRQVLLLSVLDPDRLGLALRSTATSTA